MLTVTVVTTQEECVRETFQRRRSLGINEFDDAGRPQCVLAPKLADERIVARVGNVFESPLVAAFDESAPAQYCEPARNRGVRTRKRSAQFRNRPGPAGIALKKQQNVYLLDRGDVLAYESPESIGKTFSLQRPTYASNTLQSTCRNVRFPRRKIRRESKSTE